MMKKIILLLSIAVLLFACKANTVTNLDKKSQVNMKGNWKITKVSFVGQEYFKVNSFEIADSKCFEGSTWKFISNNNKGDMTLNATGCPTFSSPIVWSINEEGNFGLKILSAGIKAKKVLEGYYLKVANQTPTSFQLIDKMNVGGKLSDIVYQFEKIN